MFFYACTKTLWVIYSQNLPPPFWCKLKKNNFCLMFSKFLTFLHFFVILEKKMLKMKISPSVWSAQHPNPGQNLQQFWVLHIPNAVWNQHFYTLLIFLGISNNIFFNINISLYWWNNKCMGETHKCHGRVWKGGEARSFV